MSWVLVCPPVIITDHIGPVITAKRCRVATMRGIQDSKYEVEILEAPEIEIVPPDRDAHDDMSAGTHRGGD